LHLINDILDLSKIEAGRLELHLTEFHFPEFLHQIAKMIHIRAEHKPDVDFVYEDRQDLPVGVYADEKRLREVLINLLDNAVKFTDQGRVTFQVTQLASWKVDDAFQESESDQEDVQSIDPRFQSQTRLRFQVDDAGCGIALEQLEKIFLPFQQVGTHRYSPEGTGLGLAISRQLVKVMGGELQVSSVVDQGSSFWFELEFPEIPGLSKKTQLRQPEVIGYTGPQQTILIADDKAENRSLLTNMLLPLGFAVVGAENGEECVELALREKPDAILLDLLMPVMDGFESAKRIRMLPEIRNIKLIAISASVFEETRRKSLKAGCDDFLSKPIELEILLECLQTHLGLEWVYRTDAGQATYEGSAIYTNLPSDVMLSSQHTSLLRKWAECGNITRLLEQLTVIEQSDERYLPLVTELKKFVKSFQFQRVTELLDHMEKLHEQ
jgi:CheY-like chemotaxis protein